MKRSKCLIGWVFLIGLMMGNTSLVLSDQFTHRIVQPTPYYQIGPGQALPPDGEFASGTLVRILKEAGSYVQVQSESNIVAYISVSDLELFTNESESISNLIRNLESPDVAVRMNSAQALGGLDLEPNRRFLN